MIKEYIKKNLQKSTLYHIKKHTYNDRSMEKRAELHMELDWEPTLQYAKVVRAKVLERYC